ncbi:hypothetical protein [Emticicia sp. BO119]|uniref:hypothetical protein n=1 Tax=Emticicia sp. BO119 TaxID=2757768 RepID=UPI0015F0537A|nr:hypothetical protein [Emticicia sp. BO119]
MEEYYRNLIIELFKKKKRMDIRMLVRKVDLNSIYELNENSFYRRKVMQKLIENKTLTIVQIDGISYYQLNET